MSCRIVIQRVIDRILLKVPFTPYRSIVFLAPSIILFLVYISNSQYQTAKYLISLLGWLLLPLAYILGILLEWFKLRSRILWLLAIAFSLISMLLFTLYFVLTLEPPYVVQLLTNGWIFYLIPCIVYSLIRIRP